MPTDPSPSLRRVGVLLAALLLATLLPPPGMAQTGDGHSLDEAPHDEPHEEHADPWAHQAPTSNFTVIERVTPRVGDYFVFLERIDDVSAERRYAVLDMKAIQVGGKVRMAMRYGYDNIDPGRGARDAWIQWRDAETSDIIKIEKFGYSANGGARVGRSEVWEFTPPYKEGVFPMKANTTFHNDVVVRKTTQIYWTDPAAGPSERNESTVSRVVNTGFVGGLQGTEIGGRNITTFRVTMRDNIARTERVDRLFWSPDFPVPVKEIGYEYHENESSPENPTIIVLQTIALTSFVTGDFPTAELAVEPPMAPVNSPVRVVVKGADPSRRIWAYGWNFGEAGAPDNVVQVGRYVPPADLPAGHALPAGTHSYLKPGTYTVKLVAFVTGGLMLNRTVNVTITNTPPVIDFTPPSTVFPGVETLLDASGSFDHETMVSSFRWDCDDGVTLDGPVVRRLFSVPVTQCRLAVADDSGGVSTRNFTARFSESGEGGTPTLPPAKDARGPTLDVVVVSPSRAAGILLVNATATDPDGVAWMQVSLNGVVLADSRSATGTFEVPVKRLRTGDNVVQVKAWDKRGFATTTERTHTYAPPVTPAAPSWRDKAGEVTAIPTALPSLLADPVPAAGTSGTPKTPGPGLVLVALAALAGAFIARRMRR